MTLTRAADRTIFSVGIVALAYIAAVWLIEATPLCPKLKGCV